jgi:biopolymer transport protein ExbD
MPSVKIPKKSTDNDMTPFVDIAFLILSFFIMATKMKPPEPVEITTPNSVSSDELKEMDAILVSLDNQGKVYFTMQSEKDPNIKKEIIKNLNTTRNLGLSEAEMNNFVQTPMIGVPFNGLKSLLSTPVEAQGKLNQPGIPVLDSANNELYFWIRDALSAYKGQKLNYLIKGDNAAKYPQFKRVLEAFKRNNQFKFQLVTSPEDAPVGTELYKERSGGGAN